MIELIKLARSQKQELGMSFAELSRRSGVITGVCKNFLLYEKNVRFSSAIKILTALELELSFKKVVNNDEKC